MCQNCHGGVEISGRSDLLIKERGALGPELDNGGADDEVRHIKIMDQHVGPDATTALEIFNWRRGWVAAGDAGERELSEFTSARCALNSSMPWVESAIETDHERYSGCGGGRYCGIYLGQ